MDELSHLAGLGKRNRAKTFLDTADEKGGCGKIGAGFGIQEEDMLCRSGRPTDIHNHHVLLDETLSKGARVAHRGGEKDKLRVCSVEPAYPLQSLDDLVHVRAEDAPVGMDFSQDHKGKVLEELLPALVVGQNPPVKHIRVGNDNLRYPGPDLLASVG